MQRESIINSYSYKEVNTMQGGKRENAGRPTKDVNKKIGYKIYITPEIEADIDIVGVGSSFSERCLYILNKAIQLNDEQKVNLSDESINMEHTDRKSVNKKIYLPPSTTEVIKSIQVGKSFSEKCFILLQKSLEYEKNENNDEKTVKFIDLFAGLGGIRLGFEQGFQKMGYKTKCVFSSEIKSYAIKAYNNYFNDNITYGDITKIDTKDIPDFDYLLAGFPCQPFSTAGKQKGFKDTRGTLFFEIERILKAKKPKGFLLENVEGLVNHDGGDTLKTILEHLEKLHYIVNWRLLDSQEFGLAQSRKRVYIVGTRKMKIGLKNFKKEKAVLGDILEHNLPTIESKFTKCLFKNYKPEEVIGKSIKDKRGGKDNIHSWEIELKGRTTQEQRELLNTLLKERRKKKWAEEIGITWMDGMPLTLQQIQTFYDVPNLKEMLDDLVNKGYLTMEHPKELKDGERVQDTTKPKGYNIVAGKLSFEFSKILDPMELAPTLVAMDVSKLGVIDNSGLRKLTIREGQRLCGYPEEYDLSIVDEKEAFDLLGNTVCVPVIKAISERMAEKYIYENKKAYSG